MKVFQNIRPIQHLDFCLFSVFLPLIEGGQGSRRLPENLQLVPADCGFEAVSVCFYANHIGRRFVDGGGQLLLGPVGRHRAIPLQPCNCLRGQIIFQYAEVQFSQAGHINGAHEIQRHGDQDGQQECHQAEFIPQDTF